MTLNFSNFENLSNVLKNYDLDMRQMDRGTFSGSLQQIQYGSVFITRVSATRSFEIVGNPPPGLRTFGIPGRNCLPFTWRNKVSDGNTIQIYNASTELQMITRPFFEAIDVSITGQTFNHLLHNWGLPELDDLITQREMVRCNPKVMRELRKTLLAICAALDADPDLLNHSTALQDLIKSETPYLLATALMEGEAQNIRIMPAEQNRALKTTIDYIQATPYDEISLNTFCAENGINERTLQRAFLGHYGITAKAYAKAHRLNHVYKSLSASNANKTRISAVAGRHGFWHMSQFAADYQRHFGELPSATLKGR